MSAVGIIAEFNPLHTGHKRLIDYAKTLDDNVACVISGNFVQRGDVAIISKQQRAKFALLCGVDIVAELPVLWSMSTAQNFALGGVWQLYNLGCRKIVFGSECGDIDALINAADVLNSDGFFEKVSEKAKSGVTFAVARENAAQEMGVDFTLLRGANNNLGIEYILAAKKLNLPIEFQTIKRIGAGHNSNEIDDGFVSSSFIREELLKSNIGYTERFMPREIRGIINPEHIADIKRLENAILCSLRTKSANDLKNLPDISEGLENKIYFSARVATSLDELYNMIKTKRYTMARIRRLVLSAFLALDNRFFMTPPPYVRVLGFNSNGLEHLKMPQGIIPVITRALQIKNLDDDAIKVFETECRATDIYNLALGVPLECGSEQKMKLLKTEELL
ncbi:MAG: nucleotidyltransferase family protein [Clostridia bacterium]|nr:nucleotidyltransferase family protein [Clostridia bacterium]